MRSAVRYLAAISAVPALLALAAPAIAQAPAKPPVKILVGFAAGGGADILARLFADKLKDELGTTVVVEKARRVPR